MSTIPTTRCATAPQDRHCLRIPTSATTLPGFRVWATSDEFPEHVRASFLGEELHIDMSNEELETHNKVKMEIARVLLTLNRRTKLGVYYGDGALVTNEAAGVSNDPDGVFVTAKSLQAGTCRLVPREGSRGQFVEMEGSPDWVLEVVSNGSVQKDTVQLREAYHRAGVREYWLVDARGETIDFAILGRSRDGYDPVGRGAWQRSRVFRRAFRLTRTRDELGLWEYTLEERRSVR